MGGKVFPRQHPPIRNCILFCQFLIVFRPQHGDFNLFMHSYSHFEPAPESSCLARLPESRQQLIQPSVQSEGLLFDIVRNVDLPQIDGHISGIWLAGH